MRKVLKKTRKRPNKKRKGFNKTRKRPNKTRKKLNKKMIFAHSVMVNTDFTNVSSTSRKMINNGLPLQKTMPCA